jgi:hypothetical protein
MPKGVYDRSKVVPKKATRKQLMVATYNSRNLLDREKDRWICVQLVAQGATYAEVAEKLHELNPQYNVPADAIRDEVEKALIDWKRDNMDKIDLYITKEVIRLEELEKEVMRNFELSRKSFRPQDYAALMKRGLTPDEIDDIYKDRELAGDPRYLDVILNIQKQRMRLLGITKGNDVAQQTIVNYNFGEISDDALARMADSLQDTKYTQIIDEQ